MWNALGHRSGNPLGFRTSLSSHFIEYIPLSVWGFIWLNPLELCDDSPCPMVFGELLWSHRENLSPCFINYRTFHRCIVVQSWPCWWLNNNAAIVLQQDCNLCIEGLSRSLKQTAPNLAHTESLSPLERFCCNCACVHVCACVCMHVCVCWEPLPTVCKCSWGSGEGLEFLAVLGKLI